MCVFTFSIYSDVRKYREDFVTISNSKAIRLIDRISGKAASAKIINGHETDQNIVVKSSQTHTARDHRDLA